MDIKIAEIGEEFSYKDLKQQCMMIYGGVGWPGKRPDFAHSRAGSQGHAVPGFTRPRFARPGFAVVLGMSFDMNFDNYDIYLLDEFESVEIRELVEQCKVLDYKYKPTMWLGDTQNDAAGRFIQEMNSELDRHLRADSDIDRREFYLSSTTILEMKHPYEYMLPKIKRLLNEEHKQLFLKDSKILNYLPTIEPQEIPALEFGDYPALEALAFALIELRDYGRQMLEPRRRRRRERHSPMRMC